MWRTILSLMLQTSARHLKTWRVPSPMGSTHQFDSLCTGTEGRQAEKAAFLKYFIYYTNYLQNQLLQPQASKYWLNSARNSPEGTPTTTRWRTAGRSSAASSRASSSLTWPCWPSSPRGEAVCTQGRSCWEGRRTGKGRGWGGFSGIGCFAPFRV